MRIARILYKGIEYTILSGGCDEGDGQGRRLTVVPCATLLCDLAFFNTGEIKCKPNEAAHVISIYLSLLCSYPAGSMDIMIDREIKSIELFDTCTWLNSKNENKCKQYYTNTVTFEDKVDIRLTTVAANDLIARIYKCNNPESCNVELLRRISLAGDLPCADVAIISSLDLCRFI